MPTVMYWMSSSASQHRADLAAALAFVALCFVVWPLLGRIHQWKMRQQNKAGLSIAVVLTCLMLSLLVLRPYFLQLFA